jgi:acyl-CoA reductase-like NAD-dependent aldehyde dehydrogenase
MKFPFDLPASAAGFARVAMLLDGKWCAGEGQAQPIIDKYKLEPFAELPASSSAQVELMVDCAQAAFDQDTLTPHERGAILDRVALLLSEQRSAAVDVLQQETGFTTADCNNEISRTVETLRLSAEEARRLSGEMVPVGGASGQEGRLAFTLRVPLGVLLAVTPFNAPLNTVTHKIAPAIGSGNVVVLKPAGQTPRTACFLATLFEQAGLPANYLQVFHGGGEAVRLAMADERVRYIAFTGSTEVGKLIQAQAGLRRTQMELGSIAFTVLNNDADVAAALPKIVGAGYRKAGQVCTSVQILLVHDSIAEAVEAEMTKLVEELIYGDPTKVNCSTGPLISLKDAERVESWINEAISKGAKLLAGGTRTGSVVAPTLLSNVSADMQVGCKEIFGPVVCIERFSHFDQAITRVNSTPFGLATGIFTNNLSEAFRACHNLRVGGVHINQTSSSRVDMMPYGGSKDSGFGREGPRYAMHEMTEERVISITV